MNKDRQRIEHDIETCNSISYELCFVIVYAFSFHVYSSQVIDPVCIVGLFLMFVNCVFKEGSSEV